MDSTKAKGTEKITEIKTDWTERIGKNVKDSINEEKMTIIQRYEELLKFIKRVHLTSEESLNHIKKPLDELETSLKCIPNGPLFNNIFPMEIKENILITQIFVAASVCTDWKKTLEKRVKDKEVVIEKCCECKNYNDCVKPVDIMEAHKLDVTLSIREPVTDVDPNLVTDALTSVSKFTVVSDDLDYSYEVPTLSNEQLEHLFGHIDKGQTIMEEVELFHLDLNSLNQETLAHCLVNKVKRLTLCQKYFDVSASRMDNWRKMLQIETFVSKIQHSDDLKLTHLTLQNFDFSDEGSASTNLASALCNVENVKLCGFIPYKSPMIERLLENILRTTPIMKSLIIDTDNLYDFGSVINPQDLKTVYRRMETLKLAGSFTLDQLQAIRSLPDISEEQYGLNDSVYHIIEKS